ncbi:MAG: putative lipid II flippase FtsW [Planctomycetes bacterium]|nr:putative lipid II flippase FtsW [Planctomycetota bacterium]
MSASTDLAARSGALECPSTEATVRLVVFVLLAFGCVVVYSTATGLPPVGGADPLGYVKKHVIFALASFVLMLAFSLVDYHQFLTDRVRWVTAGVTLALLGIVLLFPPINGARRWIHLGALSFQPSELAKLTVVLFLARFLSDRRERMGRFVDGFLPAAAIGCGVAALILLERDLGTPLLLLSVVSVMMLAAGVRLWHFLLLLPAAAPTVYVFVTSARFRLDRLKIFVDPWVDPQGAGYQVIQSLVAIHSGGWLGQGLGRGLQKHGYLPAHFTDFIFAVVAEELGFLGCLLVIGLFGVFLACGVKVVLRAPDLPGALLAAGIVASLGLQAILNIGVVTCLLPTKGIALPFVSVGGSSMLFTGAGVGLLLNIARQGAGDPSK